jgi:predicted  nucleic acid-binding Zn-ribbon protein
MDAQLIVLLEIQDLTAKVRELRAGSELGQFEKEHFGMDPGAAATQLEAKIGELEDRLEDRIRRRYDRIAGRMDRVVVPVIAGTCYGCLVSIPTAEAGERDPNASLHACEHCGRFIYILT